MCQVVALLQFILVILVTNATSERSFSAQRRLSELLAHDDAAGTFGLSDVAARSQGAALLAALDMQAVLTEFIGESDSRCMF